VVTLRIPFEPLQRGPIGRYIEIVDEDLGPRFPMRRAAKPVRYAGVDLDAPEILMTGGLVPSELDLESHQQMVYAVAMRTIQAFERALGRTVRWPWSSAAGDQPSDRLRIYPHATSAGNAWYMPRDRALYIGYAHPQSTEGQPASSEIVYFALSHDIIAHELVHPLVHAMVPEVVGEEYAQGEAWAWNEGFADIVAMLQHFDFHDLVVDTVIKTGGRIHDRRLAADIETGPGEVSVQAEVARTNPLLEIAGQAGRALKGDPIRLGLMGPPDPAAFMALEPMERGPILLAAVFDAFISVYTRRTADLLRIAGLRATDRVISPDLAERMAAEATKAARHFLTICIRALDYWPPDEGSPIGDYLRALITSDCDAVPNDVHGYREALIASFRARGIVPDGVTSWSEDGLRWTAKTSRPRRRSSKKRAVEPDRLPDIDRTPRPPDRRTLKTFAFDPSSRIAGNRMNMSVPYERLDPGPVGRLVAVVDYDSSNDRYYPSVDLETAELLGRGGVDPSDVDPRFHQQMVYATVMSTIERFETALGRTIRWPWTGSATKGALGDRLRIYPHAMQEANAYYDRRLRGLLFGYFAADETDPGRNLPGQIVYTCLSHDIVAHETTHALLDSVQPYYLERTGPDAPAFHEAFSDVIALLGHFTFADALLDTIRRTGGLIHRDLLRPVSASGETDGPIGAERGERNPLVDLAQQFGESLGNRAALRSALDKRPDPAVLRGAFEAHERGAILVAAIFDAFFSVYLTRISDLLRIGRTGGTITPAGDIHRDLATRLAREATDTAARVSSIASRALDYCPPVDVELGDYLRGLITADYERAPDDPIGYRAAFIDGFRARGIYAQTALSMTEEALRWTTETSGARVAGLLPEPGGAAARRNAILLSDFGRREAAMLGLDPALAITAKRIQATTSQQLDRSGEPRAEYRFQITQQRKVPLDPTNDASPTFPFRGGCTVILGASGEVRYVISKHIGNDARLERQRAYLGDAISEGPATAYRGRVIPRASLAALHRGL
jgi:hypothetical protein